MFLVFTPLEVGASGFDYHGMTTVHGKASIACMAPQQPEKLYVKQTVRVNGQEMPQFQDREFWDRQNEEGVAGRKVSVFRPILNVCACHYARFLLDGHTRIFTFKRPLGFFLRTLVDEIDMFPSPLGKG
jgi:hypothetical protein